MPQVTKKRIYMLIILYNNSSDSGYTAANTEKAFIFFVGEEVWVTRGVLAYYRAMCICYVRYRYYNTYYVQYQ